MPRLTNFPPGFNRSLPAISEKPLASFFSCVRKFLDNPQKLDYSVSDNVIIFNKSLTRAIHEDITSSKKRLIEIRSAFEAVEETLELRDDLYQFFNGFDDFTHWCLATNFTFDMFQDYVGTITKKIGVFQEIRRKSCRLLKTPLTWPTPDRVKDITVFGDMKFNMTWPENEDASPTSLQMKNQVIDNYNMARELIDILVNEVICPMFDKLLKWLTKNNPYLHLYTELEKKKLQFLSKMKSEKEQCHEEVVLVMKRKTWRYFDIMPIYKSSTEMVLSALEHFPELVVSYRQMIERSVLGLYDQYLKILKNFKSNLETIILVSQDAKTAAECNKAKDACRVWMHKLESTMKLGGNPLGHVPKDLPKLPKFIAYFTFKYHSL